MIKLGKKKDEKQKIAIVAHSLFPIAEPFAGGLEKFTHILAKELIDRGHHVSTYAHPDSDQAINVAPFPTLKYRIEGNPDQDSNGEGGVFPDEKYIAQSELYTKIMNDICEKDYDIIHNNSLNDMAMILGNNCGTPFLTTLHTPPFPSLQNGAVVVKQDCKEYFASVSNSLGNTWADFVDEYTTVYNGVEIEKWTFSDNPIPKTAFWYGRICKEKGTFQAILAAKMAGYKLRLAGPISEPDYFEKFVLDYLDDEDIEYIGHKNQEELNQEIGKAEAVLFTSMWDEPFGFVLAEALACGTPIIGFDSGAAPEVIDKNTGRLVEKGNIIKLAEALQSAPEINRKLCRLRAENKFSLTKMVDDYINLYTRIIEEQSDKISSDNNYRLSSTTDNVAV